MYSLMGQPVFNFFKHDLSSHVPDLPNDAPTLLKVIRWTFSSASEFPAFLGTSALSDFDAFGNQSAKLSFPFRLQFHPNTTLHNAFPDNYTKVDFEDQISAIIKPGQHIYDVYAQETPFYDDLKLIGKVIAKSTPTRSFFSDKSLFHQHTRFEKDLETYPSWEAIGRKIMDKQRAEPVPGYHYPDLPFN